MNSEAVASKVASLEGAEDGETLASGWRDLFHPSFHAFEGRSHGHIPDIYGGTYGLLTSDFPRFGIDVTMADIRDPSSFEAAINENTKVLYVETITNPVLKVCDLEAMASIAKEHGLISVVDNTFATPWACQPFQWGSMSSFTQELSSSTDTAI